MHALTIGGLIGGGVIGILNLPAGVNSFVKEFPSAAESTGIWLPVDRRLAGDWSATQSCRPKMADLPELDGPDQQVSPRVDLDLQLEFNGNEISGGILSKGLSANAPWPEAFLDGVADGTTARIRVFDWIGGKPVVFANIALKRTKDGCLKFETTDSEPSALFPSTAMLAMQPKGYFQALPREGGILGEVIKSAVKEARAQQKK